MKNQLTIYQILLALLSIFLIIKRVSSFLNKNKKQSALKFWVVIAFWIGVLSLILFPDIPHQISEKLGMGENLNTLIFTGFIIIFILIARITTSIEKIKSQITELVRKDAIRQSKIKR